MKLNSVRVQPPGSQISDYKWKDATWIKNREKFDEQVEPMAIYEVHPGSWKKHPQSEENEKGFYNTREFYALLCLCEGNGIYPCRAYGNRRASF